MLVWLFIEVAVREEKKKPEATNEEFSTPRHPPGNLFLKTIYRLCVLLVDTVCCVHIAYLNTVAACRLTPLQKKNMNYVVLMFALITVTTEK